MSQSRARVLRKHEFSFNNNSSSAQRKEISPLFSVSQKFENMAYRVPLLAGIYYNMFYRAMLDRELKMAGLQPGSKVLHIGCGPYPYTAIFLARKGCLVEGWDCNYGAVHKARRLVEKFKLNNKIKITLCDGCSADSSDCDAIWLSLNICPKVKVINKAFQSLKEGGLLVYRNLPRWMAGSYREVAACSWPEEHEVQQGASLFGSQSIVIKKVDQKMKVDPVLTGRQNNGTNMLVINNIGLVSGRQ